MEYLLTRWFFCLAFLIVTINPLALTSGRPDEEDFMSSGLQYCCLLCISSWGSLLFKIFNFQFAGHRTAWYHVEIQSEFELVWKLKTLFWQEERAKKEKLPRIWADVVLWLHRRLKLALRDSDRTIKKQGSDSKYTLNDNPLNRPPFTIKQMCNLLFYKRWDLPIEQAVVYPWFQSIFLCVSWEGNKISGNGGRLTDRAALIGFK